MNPLIASILNNPSKHQVNRDYKMSKTLDVMADNMAFWLQQQTRTGRLI